jgi:hypothetical protein
LAVAKKKLREYQQRDSSCRNKEEEKKMWSASNPETPLLVTVTPLRMHLDCTASDHTLMMLLISLYLTLVLLAGITS